EFDTALDPLRRGSRLMVSATSSVIRSAVVLGALLLVAPVLEAGAGQAAATKVSSSVAGPSAGLTKSAPAKARRAARTRRLTRSREVSARASESPSGEGRGAFGFLFPNGGNPGRWNPCAPVRYSINSTRAPAGGVADVQEAIRRVGQATGISFTYDGSTAEVPNNGSNGYSGAGTVIAWATPDETNMLTAGAAGMGGAAGVSSNGAIRITRGFVVLDASRTVPAGFGGGASQGALLMHELGHMVGLGHSTDQAQIMYPTVTPRTPRDWGAGDRIGLLRVGAPNGCLR
ncbi:MAG: matrixin family metalloprotease, partial [Acidimicrobiales bacterium]